jgi:hypothetical protein
MEKGKYAMALKFLIKKLEPLSDMPQSSSIYLEAIKWTEKLQNLAKILAKIGQKQLIRKHIANILRV